MDSTEYNDNLWCAVRLSHYCWSRETYMACLGVRFTTIFHCELSPSQPPPDIGLTLIWSIAILRDHDHFSPLFFRCES